MKTLAILTLAGVLGAPLGAQEKKPVPKDSVRVSIPGCTKGYVFTVGRRTADQPGTADLPEGMHLRMNGQKKLITEIRAHQGSMIEITGIMKKGDYPEGVSLGGGVRIAPGPGLGSSVTTSPLGSQIPIDVESWRQIVGDCPSR